MLENEKKSKPNLKGEMDELQRASQDLSRDYGIDVGVNELVKAFNSSTEETISKDIWEKLQNTESNEVEKGDFKAVEEIAKKYDKTNPKILAKALKSGKYNRPLIINIGDNYILVAGNTRLCTAAAMGMKPKVFIGKVNIGGNDVDINEIKNLKGNQKDMVYGIVNIVKKVVDMDNRRKIADDMIKQFKRENIDFNYDEFLNMCGCNKKVEAKEMTGADSSGAFSAPAFGGKKTVVNKIHNMTEEEELDEITDASSSGSYDVPLFGGTKGRKNPLSIGGPDSIYKGRAVKDKKFPKWGGPGGKFVKIKDKCKKFPYCTQGDMSALELMESQEIISAIDKTAKKYGLSNKEVSNLVLNQIKEIFI
jgi:hypothetical protein